MSSHPNPYSTDSQLFTSLYPFSFSLSLSLTREQPTGPSHTGSFLSVQVRPAGDGSTVRVRSGVLNDAQVIEVRNPASPRKQTQGFSKIGS